MRILRMCTFKYKTRASEMKSALFDEKVGALFSLLGGEYTPSLDSDDEIILTLDTGQSIYLVEATADSVEMIARLGAVPTDSAALTAILMANRDTEQHYPISFFITPNGAEVCAAIYTELAEVQPEVLNDAFQRLVSSCDWFLNDVIEDKIDNLEPRSITFRV